MAGKCRLSNMRCLFAMFPNHPYAQPKTLRHARGFGLPAAIFIITVLAMVVASITQLEESSSVAFGENLNSVWAFYAAESGAEIALARLNPAPGSSQTCTENIYVDSSGLEGLNGCSVDVDCSSVTTAAPLPVVTYYSFTSTATCGVGKDAAQRVIEVRAKD